MLLEETGPYLTAPAALFGCSPRESVVGFVIHGNSTDGLINPIKPIVSSLWSWVEEGDGRGPMGPLYRADILGPDVFVGGTRRLLGAVSQHSQTRSGRVSVTQMSATRNETCLSSLIICSEASGGFNWSRFEDRRLFLRKFICILTGRLWMFLWNYEAACSLYTQKCVTVQISLPEHFVKLIF